MAGNTQVPFPDEMSPLVGEEPEIGTLLHRLNNQLGIILANAELLETRLSDQHGRSRANQIITSVVDAMSTTRDLKSRIVLLDR